MNILIVGPIPAQFGSKNFGGVAAHTWLHARLMSEQGHAVTLLAVGSYLGRSFYKGGVRIVGVPKLSFIGMSKSLFYSLYYGVFEKDFRVAAFINRFLTKYKLTSVDIREFDVIHVHSIHSQVHRLLGPSIPPKKVLTVHSYHDVLRASGKSRGYLIKLHRKAKSWFDCVVHVSKTDEEKSRLLDLRDSKGTVVYNPVTVDQSVNERKDIDVLFVGGLIPRKRPDLLLKAFNEISENRTCVIVGDGPLASNLRQKYHFVASFVGFIGHQEVLDLMARSRILCVPSASESFGLVYIEAALKGAAVVGYEDTIREISIVAGLNEEERRFFLGLSPEVSCPKTLASNLSDILDSNEEDVNKVISSLRDKLVAQFSGDAFVAELEKIYSDSSNG